MGIRLFILVMFCFGGLSAQDPCAEGFEKNHFPQQIVNKILERFEIPSTEWVGINRALDRQVKLLEVKVQQKAAKMDPNPFNSPVLHVVVGRLYRETLIESFGYVMRQHGVKKTRQIYEMYDAIVDEKAELIWECRRKRGDF
ncbi:MAG: hypothetical protein K940chlam3_01643 [Chlamydiae bacterium]|nr:hypothetical protein [Chlamydiota bacterium]